MFYNDMWNQVPFRRACGLQKALKAGFLGTQLKWKKMVSSNSLK